MSEFEKDLANVMGSFIETGLDCVEKQNQEIEQLQQENQQLKEVIEEVRVCVRKYCSGVITNEDIVFVTPTANILQILDKGVKDE
jgi:cell division protein FtsB